MRRVIPAPVIGVLSDVLPEALTHGGLDSLFLHAGAPGDPPVENKQIKVQEWLRRVNRDPTIEPLQFLGRLLEGTMEPDLTDEFHRDLNQKRLDRVSAVLARCELRYVRGGIVTGGLGPASKSLEDLIRGRNMAALDDEFGRALRTVESNPREAVSAACNILESVCKIYIQAEKLELPSKQDLQGVWSPVRKDLGLDPSAVEADDLKAILSGLLAIASGIGALRTHASTAHGAGPKRYRLQPRHARLAVHAAHTLTAFVIESWDEKKGRNEPKPV